MELLSTEISENVFTNTVFLECVALGQFIMVEMVQYCEKLMGVVVFAKVQGQVKFASPRTFVKTTTPINSSQ